MSIQLKFRSKGQVNLENFAGEVVVDGVGGIETKDLLLKESVLDLTRVPVVCIGGRKSGQQNRRLDDFRAKAPDFSGVIYLLPYSWSNGWSDGCLLVPSMEVLHGRKSVSGGLVETQLVNHRWLDDGCYVADRAKVLHGKAVEMITEGIEQIPGPELIAEKLASSFFWEQNEAADKVRKVWEELSELSIRWALSNPDEKRRDIWGLIRVCLISKLNEAGVKKIADIPADFSITSVEVAPDFWAEREMIGTVEVPGLGRLPLKKYTFQMNSYSYVVVPAKDVRKITSWPFEAVGLALEEIEKEGRTEFSFSDPYFWGKAEDRLPEILEMLPDTWEHFQKNYNYPRNGEVSSLLTNDPPQTPAPVVWGFDLLTGEEWTAYAALRHVVVGAKGLIWDKGWRIEWYDDSVQAAEVEKKARAEATSHVFARKLEDEMVSEAETVELPVPLPPEFELPIPDLAKVMEQLGFAPDELLIEGEGPFVRTIPGHGYHSKFRDRWVRLKDDETVREWFRKEDDVIVVPENITIWDLLGSYSSERGVAGQMGVLHDRIGHNSQKVLVK